MAMEFCQKQRPPLDLSGFDFIAVVTDQSLGMGKTSFSLGSKSYQAVVCSQSTSHAEIAHEMGHCFGLDHSFDTRSTSHDAANDGRPGAYGDPLDVMSVKHVRSHSRAPFGAAGPGLNPVNLHQLGWLDPDRVESPPAGVSRVELRPLNRPDLPGPLAASVHDLFVSFRVPTRWDAGMRGGGGIFIHERAYDDGGPHSVLLSPKADENLAVRPLSPQPDGMQPGDVYENGVPFLRYTRVEVISLDKDGSAVLNLTNHDARVIVQGPTVVQWIIDGVLGIGPGGRPFKVPPRGPVRDVLIGLAVSELAEMVESGPDRMRLQNEAMALVERIARQKGGKA